MSKLIEDINKAAQDPEMRLGIGSGGDKYDWERIKADVVVLEGDDLVDALKKGGIHAAVRGGIPASRALDHLKQSFNLVKLMRAALLEVNERPVWLLPVGIDEGNTLDERDRMVRWLHSKGFEGKIGVLSKGRMEDRERGKEIAASLDQGENLRERLEKQGFEVYHYGILLERALNECDAVVAPDGISGNMIFRSLHLVAGVRSFGAPVLNLGKTFIDTSRAKTDYTDALALAAYLSTKSPKV
jgi:predicted methyltransferase MtxX (methanogen marker protein 4)